jgi:glucose-6-phosphate dehydrogenase assembly protein OpcA
VRECLVEELRRLDPDEIYQDALEALIEVDGRVGMVPRRAGSTRASRSADQRGEP